MLYIRREKEQKKEKRIEPFIRNNHYVVMIEDKIIHDVIIHDVVRCSPSIAAKHIETAVYIVQWGKQLSNEGYIVSTKTTSTCQIF